MQWYLNFWKSRGCFGKFMITSLTLFALLVCLVVAIAVAQESARQVGLLPTRTPTPTPTITQVPTNTSTPTPAHTPTPTNTRDPNVIASYEELCKVPLRDMTELEIENYIKSAIGKRVIDWPGYVYDASATRVEVAIEPRGPLWARDIVLYGVPRSVAETLRVNQPILFSGRIRHIGLFLGTICNPLEIDQATLKVQ